MQTIIVTKTYVIAARKYCRSDHVHQDARIDREVLFNRTKKVSFPNLLIVPHTAIIPYH